MKASLRAGFFAYVFISITAALFPALVVIDCSEHGRQFNALFEKLSNPINTIIREELDKEFEKRGTKPKFYPTLKLKKELHMSLVYVDDVRKERETLVVKSLQLMQDLQRGRGPIEGAMLAPNFDFFGTFKEYLVMKIDDTRASLYHLYHDVRNMLLMANDYFSKARRDKLTLLNSQKIVEHFFIPHITFAYFPIREIKAVLHIPKHQSDGIINEMIDRIEKEVFPTVQLDQDNREMKIKHFEFWGAKKSLVHRFDLYGRQSDHELAWYQRFINWIASLFKCLCWW